MNLRAIKVSVALGLFVSCLPLGFAADAPKDLCQIAMGVFGDRVAFGNHIPRFASGRAQMSPASMYKVQEAKKKSFVDRRDALSFFGFRFSVELESWVPSEPVTRTKRNLTADDVNHLIDNGVIKVENSTYEDPERRFVAADSSWKKPEPRRAPTPPGSDRLELTPEGEAYFQNFRPGVTPRNDRNQPPR